MIVDFVDVENCQGYCKCKQFVNIIMFCENKCLNK